jgi:hypothetical protein
LPAAIIRAAASPILNLVETLVSYRFRGFFTGWNPDLAEAASRRWPGCTWRPIYEPFLGVGVRCPDPGAATSGAHYNQLLELTYRIERELPGFAAEFGDPTVAFVETECFGGKCVYGGWVLQAGAIQLLIPLAESTPGTRTLERLLEPLGVRLEGGRFTPFTRGFWGEE